MDETQKQQLEDRLEALAVVGKAYRERGEPELFGAECERIRLTEGVGASMRFAEKELDKVGAFGGYQLACCEALLGNHATAGAHLETALEADVLKFSAAAQKCRDFDSMRCEVEALVKKSPPPVPKKPRSN